MPLPLWPLSIDGAEKETPTETRNRRSLTPSPEKALSLSVSLLKSPLFKPSNHGTPLKSLPLNSSFYSQRPDPFDTIRANRENLCPLLCVLEKASYFQ